MYNMFSLKLLNSDNYSTSRLFILYDTKQQKSKAHTSCMYLYHVITYVPLDRAGTGTYKRYL